MNTLDSLKDECPGHDVHYVHKSEGITRKARAVNLFAQGEEKNRGPATTGPRHCNAAAIEYACIILNSAVGRSVRA